MNQKVNFQLKYRTLTFLNLIIFIFIIYSNLSKNGSAEVYNQSLPPCATCNHEIQQKAELYASVQEKKIFQTILKTIYCAVNCPNEKSDVTTYINQISSSEGKKVSLRVEICKFYCSRIRNSFLNNDQKSNELQKCNKIYLPEFRKIGSTSTIKPYFDFVERIPCWNLETSAFGSPAESSFIRTSMLSTSINELKDNASQVSFSESSDDTIIQQPMMGTNIQGTTSQQSLSPLQTPQIIGYDAYGQPVYANVYATNNLNSPMENLQPLNMNQNTPAPYQAVRVEFCFDGCTCIAYLIMSIIATLAYLGAFAFALHLSASLFSKGILSPSFYRGGGEWLIVATCVGGLTGGLVIGFVTRCSAMALLSSGSWLTVAYSLLLVGKRGAFFGGIGGIGFGGTIGYLIYPYGISFGIGLVVGLMVGVILGFFPFARQLKMNERYIRGGTSTGRLSDEVPTSPSGRRFSDDFVERRNAAKASEGEKRRASWGSTQTNNNSLIAKSKDDTHSSSAKHSSAQSDDAAS